VSWETPYNIYEVMVVQNYSICQINANEINAVADILSAGYYNDEFFIWSVPSDADRHKVVADYYKVYLGAVGCVAYVAESPAGIIGVAVWLPHDTDAAIYEEIDRVTGKYSPQFRAVSDNSHFSEPPMAPFYQLVGFVVTREAQGLGVGSALLQHSLNIFDSMGIPTYLEASTPYFGGGVYGRFGYQPVGELMTFAETAVLYPLWRHAKPIKKTNFGGYEWRVLAQRSGATLLLMENVMSTQTYHDVFEDVTWETSHARKYLNSTFYESIAKDVQIVETHGDKVFLLSIEEVAKYLGGQLGTSGDKFYVNDYFNNMRKAIDENGDPCRWMLRTPGSVPGFAAVVTVDGRVCITGDFVNRGTTALFKVGVRPAMWVKM